jgi:hypothetical protein
MIKAGPRRPQAARRIASSGPALLISFSEGISIASSKRVFGELGWFRQSCGTFRGISAQGSPYDDSPQLFRSHLAQILVSFLRAASHHLATFTLKVTVLAPPAFLMTNLYCPSFSGVTLTEHFGPGESSLATSAPEES